MNPILPIEVERNYGDIRIEILAFFSKWDMAFRNLSSNVDKKDCVIYGFLNVFMKYNEIFQMPIPIDLLEYWGEIAIANHCVGTELFIVNYYLDHLNMYMYNGMVLNNYENILEAALVDAKYDESPLNLTFIAYKINEIPGFNERLKTKYQFNHYIQEILSISPGSRYYEVDSTTGEPIFIFEVERNKPEHITDRQILYELSDMGNVYIDYYPF